MARRLASSLVRLPSHACRNTGDPSIAFLLRRAVKQSTATWHCHVQEFSSYSVRLARLRSSVDTGRFVSLRPTNRWSPIRHSRKVVSHAMVAVHPTNSRNFNAEFHGTRRPAWDYGTSGRTGFHKRISRNLTQRVNAEGGKAEDDVDDNSASSGFLTLPTVLTLVRVVAVPFIIPGALPACLGRSQRGIRGNQVWRWQ